MYFLFKVVPKNPQGAKGFECAEEIGTYADSKEEATEDMHASYAHCSKSITFIREEAF